MKLVPAFLRGKKGSALVSAGTAAMTALAANAVAEIFAIARMAKLPA
jgi:histidine ammonia-lyase